MHKTTRGKTITPESQRRIDQHYEGQYDPATTNDMDETENQPLNLSATSTGDKTGSQMHHNGRKRTHDIAFSSDPQKISLDTAKPGDSKRSVQDLEQLWEKITTDMEILVEVYQDFATDAVKSVDPPVGRRRLKALDMSSLIKPTSYPECVQQLVTALSAKALHECCDDAFDALDYDIADNLCNASRSLLNHYRQVEDAGHGDPSPNEAQKRACERFIDEAKKYLQMWEQMTERDAVAELVMAGWSDDSNERLEQLIRFATTDGAIHITVDVIMQYMQAAQVYRAGETLQKFLVKVKRMTKALETCIEDLEELQK